MYIGVLIKCVKRQNKVFDNSKPSCFEINKSDMFSLENALKVKDKVKCKVCVITVGAPAVNKIIQKLYNFGVDKVIVVSDNDIAGSDTFATSTVLSKVIDKENIDLIFTGKESSDSATAQVGPQLAAMLNCNLACNVSSIECSNDLTNAICVFEESGKIYKVNYSLPLVVVTGLNVNVLRVPKIADFISSQKKHVDVLNLEKLSLDARLCGIEGSYTKVINIEDIIIKDKGGTLIDDIDSFIINKIKRIKNNVEKNDVLSSCVDAKYKKLKIYIIGDPYNEFAKESFKRVISYFSVIGDVSILLFKEYTDLSDELLTSGATEIYNTDVVRNSIDYLMIGKKIANILTKINSKYVLLISSTFTRVIAPIIATYLKTGLTADCSDITFNENGFMEMTRPTFGDSKKATIICHKTNPQMATIRQSCFLGNYRRNIISAPKVIKLNSDVVENVNEFTILNVDKISQLEWNKDVILIAGGGLDKENTLKLLKICTKLQIDFGVTRVVVDKGIVDHKYQIGQTGESVAHKLCIMFGVSGAIEHTVGISKRSEIISVNIDENCELNKISDFYAIADANEVITRLGDKIL